VSDVEAAVRYENDRVARPRAPPFPRLVDENSLGVAKALAYVRGYIT
jgi:hypothetical protein